MDNNNDISIIDVAEAQRAVLWCVLINFIVLFLFNFAFIIVDIVQLYFVYKLLKSLHSKLVVLWMIGVLVPLLGLILMIILNSRATKNIRAAGFRVGLMGADLKDIKSKMASR